MAKLAFELDLKRRQRPARRHRVSRQHSDLRPRLGESARVLPVQPDSNYTPGGTGADALPHGSEQDVVDDKQPAGALQRRKLDVHAVSDVDLKDTIKWVEWTPELLEKAARAYYFYCIRYDHNAIRLTSVENYAQLLVINAESILQLGDGGIVTFFPVMPGHQALFQAFIWDPQYMRRTELLQAVLRLALRHWSLRRIVSFVASRCTLGRKFNESLGLTQEGCLRENLLYDGGVDDSLVYGLLAREVNQ